ncbi:hypothetical protein HPP92_003165 [Vanilla planifolia]|uniref:HMA domain-containing protein n=1 Tax=Vanilla planifolia TaxID=51239 RepID=A0A835VN65_VANPL|nr:hypothetical protein HPP92_003556 [Vanilla planifolia]KAG0503093.1 hypothetical protein HPP92_003165 [Vanilla planifolia]
MSKEDEIKFLKVQTCVLKVNIHCDGCKQKVKKILQKVDGVFHTTIDAEQGKVTVSSNVDPATLVKKLNKAGKHAELLLPKGINLAHLQKPQLENQKGQKNKDNTKPAKVGAGGGGGGVKDQKFQAAPVQQLQQMKGFKDPKLDQWKDLKLPLQKDPKSVKFALPPDDCELGSDYDDDSEDDDDYDYDDLDDLDGFDADYGDFQNLKLKPGHAPPNAFNGVPVMPEKKTVGNGGQAAVVGHGKKGGGGGGGGGGELIDIPVHIKGANNSSEAKNGKKGGGVDTGKGGRGVSDSKNAANNGKSNNPNGGGGKKGGGKHEPPGPAHCGGAPNLPPGSFPGGMNAGQMGPMAQKGNMPTAVQGLPLPAGAAPPGYFPGSGMPALNPDMMAAGNPYQQQYVAAMMQQQQQQQQQQQLQQLQQQRMMMMMNGQDRGYPPMMGYPHPPAMYMPPPPPAGEPYTNYFSDENANSCSIM